MSIKKLEMYKKCFVQNQPPSLLFTTSTKTNLSSSKAA